MAAEGYAASVSIQPPCEAFRPPFEVLKAPSTNTMDWHWVIQPQVDVSIDTLDELLD